MSGQFVPIDFPAWIAWGVRAGAHLRNSPSGKGPNGRNLCSWCATEVPKGRKSWCGDKCVKQFLRVHTWQDLSGYIIERDVVCQKCGCDHPGWNQARSLVRTTYVTDRYSWANYHKPTLIEKGYIAKHHELREWWEVDHILPVKDGGTDDPANLRLLCHACHVAAGIEQRQARKARIAPTLDLGATA